MEQDEADRSELALLQKESSLWSADSEANGSVTFNKDEYKKFKSKTVDASKVGMSAVDSLVAVWPYCSMHSIGIVCLSRP